MFMPGVPLAIVVPVATRRAPASSPPELNLGCACFMVIGQRLRAARLILEALKIREFREIAKFREQTKNSER